MGIVNLISSQADKSVEELWSEIAQHEGKYPFDNQLHTAKAVLLFFEQDVAAAEEEILKAVKGRPRNCTNHLYYAIIAFSREKYAVAARECLLAFAFATQETPDDWHEAGAQLQHIMNECVKRVDRDELEQMQVMQNILKSPGSFFPLYWAGEDAWNVYVLNYLYKDKEKEYNHFIGVHSRSYVDTVTASVLSMYKSTNGYNLYASFPNESWNAKTVDFLELDGEACILPLAASRAKQDVFFNADREQVQTFHCPGMFRYYRIDKPVHIFSADPFIAGEPVRLTHNEKRKKLVLMIFHDALSQFDLSNTDFSNMPFTKEFFDKGMTFNNCYSTAEWTHPSFGSIFTGLYTTNHHMIDRSSANRFPSDTKTIGELFKEAGYFTANISSSIGISPYLGGLRGFDRGILKSCMGAGDGQLIEDTIDHLEAFAETDQFVLLSLFDFHRVTEDTDEGLISLNIGQQTAVRFDRALDKVSSEEKSVRKPYHEPSIERYHNAQRQADRRLRQLYEYVTEHYQEDEYIVCLISDHGTGILEDDALLLKRSQMNTVMMMRGGGISVGASDEYISHIDFLPVFEKLAGLSADLSEKDCRMPKSFGGEGRAYVYSESIYPGQTYKAAVRDGKYEYYFETENVTRSDGSIDLSEGYVMHVFEEGTRNRVEDAFLYDFLEMTVYEHIKRNQYIP